MSVENFPFSRLTPYCLSDLHLLLIGSIADLVTLCNVAFRVTFALSVPIMNRSTRNSPDILERLSVKEYVYLVGISSSASLNLVILAIVIGIVASNCSLNPGSCNWSRVESVDPSDTIDGFHSFFPVRFNFGHSLNSLFVGDLASNCIFVPIVFICIFTVSPTAIVRPLYLS